MEGIHVYIQLIHFVVLEKLARYCNYTKKKKKAKAV